VVSMLSDLDPTIAQLRRSVWTSVVLGIFALYGTLFSIVRSASRDLERQQANLREALVGTIRSLANAVDARDLATGNHSSCVAEYAADIARAMKLNAEGIREAEAAGFLHDLGKIGVPDSILTKRGPLTKREWIAVQHHSVVGYDILRPVPIPEQVKLAVRHSHERWDGTGYPAGLAGEEIPLLARGVAPAGRPPARPRRLWSSGASAPMRGLTFARFVSERWPTPRPRLAPRLRRRWRARETIGTGWLRTPPSPRRTPDLSRRRTSAGTGW